MRILIIRPGTSDFGKIGTYNVQEVGLAVALKTKGHDVSVVYLNRDVREIEVDETYSFVYYFPHKHIGIHGIFDVNLLEQYAPDRVIMFSDSQLWSKNIIDWCTKRGIPCVHYFGNVLSDNPGWLHQFYTRLFLFRNRRSYFKSINAAKTKKVEAEMDRLGVPCKKVINVGLDRTILHDNLNLDLNVRRSLGYEKSDTILLFVGRLVDYKKPIEACKIAQRMKQVEKNTKLIIIGKGPLEQELKDYISRNGIEDMIKLIGRVPYEEMYKYFVSSDCLINLSDKEIFGMTILEAMYYRLPVIAHTAPGPNDIITNKLNGYLCNTQDEEQWVNLICDSINRREEIGQAARDEILKNYLWDSIADEFIQIN